MVWCWIGPHADYDKLISNLQIGVVANKACSGRQGVWRHLRQFYTPQPFSVRTAFRRPPQRQYRLLHLSRVEIKARLVSANKIQN